MSLLVASADASDPSQDNVFLVAMCLGTLMAVSFMVLIVIALARGRNASQASTANTASSLWGLVAIASGIYTLIGQLKWSKAHATEMMSGYGDPSDTAPPLPWVFWSVLGVMYVILIAWAAWKRRANVDGE